LDISHKTDFGQMNKSKSFKIFIVEDDRWYCRILEYQLSLHPDYEVSTYSSAKECLAHLHENPAIITLDYSLPDGTGTEVLRKIKAYNPEIEVVVISGQEDINTAVSLLKEGAFDYIMKDENTKERLWNTVQNMRKNLLLQKQVEELKEEISQKYDFSNFILGSSEPLRQVFRLMTKAANTNITVSVTGETGTGKELVAKAVHFNSGRCKQPFVAVNVAAIPKDLLESELFGHEKGAFTGAVARRLGKFEEAHKGTIFLDEIGELDLNLQAKLLRVLQEKEVVRVGANAVTPIDVRIIVATHKNLAEEVKKGRFREDLYYRLLGLPIALPPLRERGNDILPLARHFISRFCQENKLPPKTLSIAALKKLMGYSYPGNVRELKAVVELAVVIADGEVIGLEEISFAAPAEENFLAEEATLKDFNTRILQHYLNKYKGNVLQVAARLEVGKSTIYRMIQNKELRV
jgi:two-component system response regulator AtoC